jgi:NADPH:quinone reductase-like Zn-dependent oxidoreductase
VRAVICPRYGPPDVLRVVDLPVPVPGRRELLVRNRATLVSSGDCRMRGFTVPRHLWIPARLSLGLSRPRHPVLGLWFAGEVAAVGDAVTSFRVGDRVCARAGGGFGAYAEYVRITETGLVAPLPASLSETEAVALPFGGGTALHFLRKVGVGVGQRVVVYGASGAVGTAAVQLATHLGAEVVGVCSGRNADLVRSLGAGAVVDYRTEGFVRAAGRADVVFDAVGKTSKAVWRTALGPGGRYVSVLTSGHASGDRHTLAFLLGLAEEGALRPVIDRVYRLEQMTAAHAYVEAGHARGAVVVTVDPD